LADFHIFEQAAARWVSRRQSEFDIIQACELPTFVATAKGIGVKTPIVMRLTAPNYVDTNGGLSRADAVIASGATMAHVSAGPRVDCVNVPNGVDTELFRPHQSDFRFRTGIGDCEFVVLYVARFQDFKNHILLLNAFGILLKAKPDCRLVLVGSGPLEKRTRNHAERLGISERIIFMGEVDFSSLPGVYAAADVMAISSDFESFCFAALEAMASGLPVVTTDCGWVPKLVGEKGGVVVPLRDPEAFANALKTLADDGDSRSRMGVFNRAKAEAEHGWPASAKRLLCVYERLLQDQSVKR
jgi:glycosyltransferase involved in cell wall biosynthesis